MVKLKQVEIIGAGPAGLYAAILLKLYDRSIHVCVHEQNEPSATFGFGVVFSDRALDFLQADDPATHALIEPGMERWRDMTLSLPHGRITLDGIGFSAIGRLALLEILQRRAGGLGVELRYRARIESPRQLTAGADLVIGADGLNSLLRQSDEAAFGAEMEYLDNRFAWFGTGKSFDNLTQTFIHTPKGVLNAHHYRYAPDLSTFIVECDRDSFFAHGFDSMDEDESARVCADLFGNTLGGAPLLTNFSYWRRFPKLWCRRWVSGRTVLLGDAAHTAHFSIGSGTRLAMEDSIALVKALKNAPDVDGALQTFQASRPAVARKIVEAANTSAGWYEAFGERMKLPVPEFAHSYLMRSGRIDPERLRRISPVFMAEYERHRESSTD